MPLWKVLFALSFGIPFLLLFPLFYWAFKTQRFDFAFRLKRVWARCISVFSFVFPKVIYVNKKYNLPKPCVIVGNHTSYLDICYSPFYIDHTAIYMGKAELIKIPLFGLFFKYMDIPVNRKSVTDAHKAFVRAGEEIEANRSMVIYPEGMINNEGKLKPFKNGAFKLAIEKQVPIVPVVNVNNWRYLQNGGFFKSNGRPGMPTIVVGEPIETKGLTLADIEKIKEKVFTFTQLQIQKYDVE
jgi:1-acyl-sn-glycerol-3-phosphate acyltransferase